MGTIMKNNINYSGGGGSGASTAAAVSYNNTASGLTSGNAQGAIDELAEGLASKADVSALDGKADRLTYNESSSTLLLQSGGVTLSSVHIEGGSIATIVHVQTHEQSWWNNPAVTIDVKDSDEDINNGHFDATGDYIVKVHHIGTYTVTVTDDQGHKYVTTFEDNVLGAVLYVFVEPYGWEGWLKSASMATTAYSSLEDVLADEKALRELFTKHASVDFLVNWLSNDNISAHTILNNDYCAKWINLRDYALDMLYENSTIKAVMDEVNKYGYGEWALIDGEWQPKGAVPVMTSNTAPYGTASASSAYGNNTIYYAYNAFDKSTNTHWLAQGASPQWIQYRFINPVKVNRLYIHNDNVLTAKIQASNDGDVYIDIDDIALTKSQIATFDVANDNYYLYYRLYITSADVSLNSGYPEITELQFYGRQLNVSVPEMTSNTAPYGEVTTDSIYSSDYDAYKAFCTDNKAWCSSYGDRTAFVMYNFKKQIEIRSILFIEPVGSDRPDLIRDQIINIQISDNGVDFTTVKTFNVNTFPFKSMIDIHGVAKYVKINFSTTQESVANMCYYLKANIYGVDYSEREFEEGSTMKYIYDHGVEMESTDNYISTANGSIVDENSSILINKTSAGACVVFKEYKVDFTPYKLERIIIGENCYGTSASTPQLAVGSALNTPNNKSYLALYNSVNNPYNSYLDVSLYNEELYATIGINTSTADSGKININEWWLE